MHGHAGMPASLAALVVGARVGLLDTAKRDGDGLAAQRVVAAGDLRRVAGLHDDQVADLHDTGRSRPARRAAR